MDSLYCSLNVLRNKTKHNPHSERREPGVMVAKPLGSLDWELDVVCTLGLYVGFVPRTRGCGIAILAGESV